MWVLQAFLLLQQHHHFQSAVSAVGTTTHDLLALLQICTLQYQLQWMVPTADSTVVCLQMADCSCIVTAGMADAASVKAR